MRYVFSLISVLFACLIGLGSWGIPISLVFGHGAISAGGIEHVNIWFLYVFVSPLIGTVGPYLFRCLDQEKFTRCIWVLAVFPFIGFISIGIADLLRPILGVRIASLLVMIAWQKPLIFALARSRQTKLPSAE